jgi:hypothetical protein
MPKLGFPPEPTRAEAIKRQFFNRLAFHRPSSHLGRVGLNLMLTGFWRILTTAIGTFSNRLLFFGD